MPSRRFALPGPVPSRKMVRERQIRGERRLTNGVPCLTDQIEAYLLDLLRREGTIEMQRSELAERFGCVPSQINYVLVTRFAPERGFVIESRRGGGGFIRLVQLPAAAEDLPAGLSQAEAEGWLDRLEIQGRERRMLRAILDRRTLDLPVAMRDALRSRILRAVMETLS